VARCRSCDAEIRFEPTAKGKLMPVSVATGESHFADCPNAARHRTPALPDNACASCGSDNVERLPGTGPHFGAIRCQDCGSHRWLRKPVEA
jgi:hypothetical protein